MFVGVYTTSSQSVTKGSLEETIVKNQSVLLIDTPENYFNHLELKNQTVFSIVNFVQSIILLRNPADTLLRNFISKKLGPTLIFDNTQNAYRPSKGTVILSLHI